MRFGLFGFSDFRKLVFLDHRNFGEISQNLHSCCIFKVQFCQIFLKIKFFLNEFEFSLKFYKLFSCFKNFRRLLRRQLVFWGDFCTKFWSFWTSRSSPQFWQVTHPIEDLINIYIRTRYWGSDRPKGGVIKIEK